MKHFLYLCLILVVLTGTSYAHAVDEISEINQLSGDLIDLRERIEEELKYKYPFNPDKSNNSKEQVLRTTVLYSICSDLLHAQVTLNEFCLVFIAFSEAPLSDQGKQLQQLIGIEMQVLTTLRHKIGVYEEAFPSMNTNEGKLYYESLRLLDEAIKKCLFFTSSVSSEY